MKKQNNWKLAFIVLISIMMFNFTYSRFVDYIERRTEQKRVTKIHRRAAAQVIDYRNKALALGKMEVKDYTLAKFKEWLNG